MQAKCQTEKKAGAEEGTVMGGKRARKKGNRQGVERVRDTQRDDEADRWEKKE